MLANVKIDSPSGCGMVAGTLNSASEPGQEVGDEALVRLITLYFLVINNKFMRNSTTKTDSVVNNGSGTARL